MNPKMIPKITQKGPKRDPRKDPQKLQIELRNELPGMLQKDAKMGPKTFPLLNGRFKSWHAPRRPPKWYENGSKMMTHLGPIWESHFGIPFLKSTSVNDQNT